jgi:hypothetical protein
MDLVASPQFEIPLIFFVEFQNWDPLAGTSLEKKSLGTWRESSQPTDPLCSGSISKSISA